MTDRHDNQHDNMYEIFSSHVKGFRTDLQNAEKRLSDTVRNVQVDLKSDLTKVENTISESIDMKFQHHNDYHVNCESKYAIWFKIALLSILFTLVLSASGFIDAVAATFIDYLKVFF